MCCVWRNSTDSLLLHRGMNIVGLKAVFITPWQLHADTHILLQAHLLAPRYELLPRQVSVHTDTTRGFSGRAGPQNPNSIVQ
jgi:hypothetical protein